MTDEHNVCGLCGASNPDDAIVCVRCGALLAAYLIRARAGRRRGDARRVGASSRASSSGGSSGADRGGRHAGIGGGLNLR
jgi:hypothetical protein